jgi:hypothetical protein
MSQTLTMLDTQSVVYATEPKNAEGQDVTDPLTWTAAPAELVTLTPDAPPSYGCTIKGNGAPGTVVVTVGGATGATDTITLTLEDETAASLGLHLVSGPF